MATEIRVRRGTVKTDASEKPLDIAGMAAAAGAVAIGVAVFEAALLPGLMIGVVAVLAPKVAPKLSAKIKPLLKQSAGKTLMSALASPETNPSKTARPLFVAGFPISRVIGKTITFRTIVTTLDVGTTYIAIGNLGTAIALSGFSLVTGPFIYLGHEMAWDRFVPADTRIVLLRRDDKRLAGGIGALLPMPNQDLSVDRTVAKTMIFAVLSSAIDFTKNYIVIGDFVTAAGLASLPLLLGPIVYFGHEKAWDYLNPLGGEALETTPGRGLALA